jgi:UDP-GlcNAc:undecaprenyl-phosphate/decaprenyl-phosphate GlcNAc-1-phosphate transferase
MDKWQLVIAPFLLALIVSLVITPVTIWFFKKVGFVIDPKKQSHPAHTHSAPVPKGGGIPIVLAVLITVGVLLSWDRHLIAIALGLGICLVVGLVDDVHSINPYWRLLANLLAAVVVVASGIGIAYVTNPFGGIIDLSGIRLSFDVFGETREMWLLADLFALLWIPFLINSINWSSGLDGQVSGVVAIAALVIGVLSLSFGADITQWPVAVLAFSLSGAFVGLALFHFYPQKIMPGYSATSSAGFLLAVLAILATAKVGTAIVVLGLPLIDAIYSIARRLWAKKSPVWGDRGHLHHKLLDMGWGKRRIALFYWFLTAVLGVVALSTNAEMKLFAILSLSVIIAGFLLWVYFGPFLKRSDRVSG